MTADELSQMRDVRRGPFAAVEGAMAAIEINLHVPADTAQPSRLLIISPSADRELRRILSCAIGRAT
ncbi:hypothetical protein [Bosea sp. AS-1]|uniref:hypothetical protein n=1 Tax=Bosea sp. AS-1 TaxID=2015316 RepID=UPI000B77CCD9|nr:hypothetical protein [Bosea sp. AS-1]